MAMTSFVLQALSRSVGPRVTAAATFAHVPSCSLAARGGALARTTRLLSSESEAAGPKTLADKIMTFLGWAVVGTVTASAIGSVYFLGQPASESDDTSVSSYLVRTRRNLNQLYQDWRDPTPEPLLPPQRPPAERASDYTLVLDLEETLLHSSWTTQHGWRTVKRPGLDIFLRTCFQLGYEIVVFSEQEVMDSTLLIEKMDPYHVVEYRLFKGHMRFFKGELVKDLSLLNRDESKVIVIDNNRHSFSKHPHNGLCIKPFSGDTDDTSLQKMAVLLTRLMHAQPEDVRDIIRTYEGFEDAGEEFEERQKRILQQTRH